MSQLLEKYFFSYIDRGSAQDDTPLFTGLYEGKPLINELAKEHLALCVSEIEELIDQSRREVEL